MSKFSDRLRTLRKRSDLTQPQLAEKLGVSNGAVGNWESEKFVPSRETMRKIAGILGTTEMYLSGDSDIDSGAFIEQGPEYASALPYSRMTSHELEFIFESRQRELNAERDPQRRRELLGVISEVTGELKKRIPADAGANLIRRGIQSGDAHEVKPEEKK